MQVQHGLHSYSRSLSNDSTPSQILQNFMEIFHVLQRVFSHQSICGIYIYILQYHIQIYILYRQPSNIFIYVCVCVCVYIYIYYTIYRKYSIYNSTRVTVSDSCVAYVSEVVPFCALFSSATTSEPCLRNLFTSCYPHIPNPSSIGALSVSRHHLVYRPSPALLKGQA